MLYQFFIDANDKDGVVSARGLMIIFMIGLIPIILGIDLTDVHLELSWLKNFEVPHKDRILLIYAGLIIYSLYRFRLINKDTREFCLVKSMGLFITSKVAGDWFVHKFIFLKDDVCGAFVDYQSTKPCVVVSANYDPDIPHESPDTFKLMIDKNGELCCELRHSEGIDWKKLGLSPLWNVHFDAYCYPFDGEKVQSDWSPVKNVKMASLLRIARFMFSFKAMAKDVNCLDYYLPLYCNTVLASYLIWQWAFK